MAIVEETSTPEFAHAVRGYDRFQVDEYIDRLNKWATGAQMRAQQAEKLASERHQEMIRLSAQVQDLEADGTGSPEAAVKEVAERFGGALDCAIQEAEGMRSDAAAQSQEIVASAERQARDMVGSVRTAIAELSEVATEERRAAKQRSAVLLRDAAAEAEAIVASGRKEADRIVAEAEHEARQLAEHTEAERRAHAKSIEGLSAERERILADLGRLRGAIQTIMNYPSEDGSDGHVNDDATVVMAQNGLAKNDRRSGG